MTVKKWLGRSLLALLVSMPLGSAFSQIRGEPDPAPVAHKPTTEEEKAREQTRWMHKNLDLELDQFMQVNNINLTYARKLDSLEKLTDKKIRNDYRQQLKAQKEQEIKTVLTPDQYKQYVAHKEKQVTLKKSPFAGTY